ncbi:MAG: hypothetical protein WCT49_05895 [Candidatus Paceibacterota bacterium]|jgi:hypothetical protein|nr:hypothetical protein [Candidatus Paceibacterota bacterium]
MKKEIREDILTQTEALTGIPIWEIINATRLAKHLSFYEFDVIYLRYQQQGLIDKNVRVFAMFLQRAWIKAHDNT